MEISSAAPAAMRLALRNIFVAITLARMCERVGVCVYTRFMGFATEQTGPKHIMIALGVECLIRSLYMARNLIKFKLPTMLIATGSGIHTGGHQLIAFTKIQMFSSGSSVISDL